MADIPDLTNSINEGESTFNSWAFLCNPSFFQNQSDQNLHASQSTTVPHQNENSSLLPSLTPVEPNLSHQSNKVTSDVEPHKNSNLKPCFLCNEDFPSPSELPENVNDYIQFENLFKILQLPVYDFASENKPFCSFCVKQMNEYFAMQKKIQELINLISKLKSIMATKVVKSFPLTSENRENYLIKQKIHKALSDRIDLSNPTSYGELQGTLNCIVKSLNQTHGSGFDASIGSSTNCSGDTEVTIQCIKQTQNTLEIASGSDSHLDQRCVSPLSNGSEHSVEDILPTGEDAVKNDSLKPPSVCRGTTFFDTPARICKDGRIVTTKIIKESVINHKKTLICQYCPKSFPSNFALRTHERSHTGEKPFVCKVCGKGCTTKGNLMKHEINHCKGSTQPTLSSGETNASANVQNVTNVPSHPENVKELEHIGVMNPPNILVKRSSLSCRTCSKLFPSQSQLDTHMRVHTGEKPFKCAICEQSFTTKFNMQKHEWTHDEKRYQGEPKHECEICHKKYHLKMTLYTHRRDHFRENSRPSGKRPRRKFPTTKAASNSKKARRTQANKPENRNKTDANVSTQIAEPRQSLKDDTARTNETKYDDIDAFGDDRCDSFDDAASEICVENMQKKQTRIKAENKKSVIRKLPKSPKKEPINKRRLKGIRKVQGDQVAKCQVCGKVLKTIWQLRTHMRVHTGEKPYACLHPGCNRRFADLGNRMKHFKSHDETRFKCEPKLICDICGKKYHLPGTLYHHRRRVHMGVAYHRPKTDVPTSCPICHKFLQRSYHLNEHIRRMHKGERKFNCKVCDKPFFTLHEAKGHVVFHDPTKLQRILFKYMCTACPPEYVGYPSKDAVRLHWSKEHQDKPLPNEYKGKLKPEAAGRYECLECHKDNRPVYKYPRGLRRHKRAHHLNHNPQSKNKKKFVLTRHNIAKLEANESESGSSEDDEMQATSDEDKKPRVIDVPLYTKRSLRQRRSNKKYIDDESENEDEIEPMKNYIGNKLTSKSRVCTGKLSMNLKAQMNKLLGNKVLRISLTRVNEQMSENQIDKEIKLENESD